MESNISFDHVQLVVFQELMKKKLTASRTIWNRIGSALGICTPRVNAYAEDLTQAAILSFTVAELIMALRNVRTEHAQELEESINEIVAKAQEGKEHLK